MPRILYKDMARLGILTWKHWVFRSDCRWKSQPNSKNKSPSCSNAWQKTIKSPNQFFHQLTHCQLGRPDITGTLQRRSLNGDDSDLQRLSHPKRWTMCWICHPNTQSGGKYSAVKSLSWKTTISSQSYTHRININSTNTHELT